MRTTLAGNRARVSFENLVAEVEKLRLAQRSVCINPIRERERGPNRHHRTCTSSAESAAVKKRSARRVGGKTNESRASSHDGTSLHVMRGEHRKMQADEMHFSTEVVARSFHDEVFTDIVERGSRRSFEHAWATAKRFASRRSEVARQARHGIDRRKKIRDDPSKPPRRRETARCSVAQSTGGNSSRLGGANGIRKSP